MCSSLWNTLCTNGLNLLTHLIVIYNHLARRRYSSLANWGPFCQASPIMIALELSRHRLDVPTDCVTVRHIEELYRNPWQTFGHSLAALWRLYPVFTQRDRLRDFEVLTAVHRVVGYKFATIRSCNYTHTLNMEARGSSWKSETVYKATRCCIPEEIIFWRTEVSFKAGGRTLRLCSFFK